jgi:diguanylate cyclase (GGDEF)-like protein
MENAMFADLARRAAAIGPRRQLYLTLIVAAVLALLLVFLFTRTGAVDLEAQDRVMLDLRELQRLDAQWDANILRAQVAQGAPDAPLTAVVVPRMHVLLARIGRAPTLARDPEAAATYRQLLQALRSKEQLVEQFRQRNPPLRAALNYVPPAIAALKTELDGIGGALAPARLVLRLDGALNDLLTEILRYNLAPTPALAARIEELLGDIEAQEIAFSPAIGEMIDAIAHHSRVILRNRPEVNAIDAAIAATGTSAALEQLGRQFEHSFAAVLEERQRYRGYLLVYSALLLVLLIYAGSWLWRSYRIIGQVNRRLQAANETLEQRVAERTAALEAQSQQLALLAQHDSLTGLINYGQLTRLLEHALVRAGRRSSVVVLMFIDLDGFKAVNDTWGHATGDIVLKEVARRVQGRLRAEDALARLGGDEFVIMLEEVSSREGALRVAELALHEIRGIDEAGGHPVAISASIGIASARGRAGAERGSAALLAEADHAMYQAKEGGKGMFVISPHAQW